jgi:hypothetical protein
MRFTHLFLAAAAAIAVPTLPAHAQTSRDPTGHWDGRLTAPAQDVPFAIDLARNRDGALGGTIDLPMDAIKGLPLARLSFEGSQVTFELRAGAGGGAFRATLSEDGKAMAGDFAGSIGSVPFRLTRTGSARIEAAPRSAPISRELEGQWNGTLEAAGVRLRLELHITNTADGSALGHVVSLDEDGLDYPIVMTQAGATLAFTNGITGGSYSGALDGAGTALVGTYTNRGVSTPLVFRRTK